MLDMALTGCFGNESPPKHDGVKAAGAIELIETQRLVFQQTR
ncbi:MAG: hypothetical protein ACJ8FY_01665 [Gemmataceae bacterium]